MDIRGRMGTRYEDRLYAHLPTSPPDLTGHSSYFSRPSPCLDPHLFSGDKVKPNVRTTILNLIYGFWNRRYQTPMAWSTVWIAGSGASYQWAADRGGIGDLDILIGVNYIRFFQTNPEYQNIPEDLLADRFNKELHDYLWPETATFKLDGREYEITFYVNPGATDIRAISPYAAYSLTHDDWTVRPIELPEDWGPQSLPKEWFQKFDDDNVMARRLIDRYHGLADHVRDLTPGSPQWTNGMAMLGDAAAQAVAHFEDIHTGRRNAFARGGQGFLGFGNARWQMAKGNGIVDALRAIRQNVASAHHERNTAVYGQSDLGVSTAAIRAALWSSGRNVEPPPT